MKNDQVQIDMKISLNDLPDGQVYTVKWQQEKMVGISYQLINGDWVATQAIDAYLVHKPTKLQLLNDRSTA